jgi:hypothetical protein
MDEHRWRAAWQRRRGAGRLEGRGFAGMRWMRLDVLGWARMGLEAPAQACIPHSARYT